MIVTATQLRKITVNGAGITSAARTLTELVDEQGFGDAKVATAVNGDFVPVRDRDALLIAEGDRIEILSARQGG